MSDYKPTEYIVDFGDCRSNQFVRLSMALIEQNGAKVQEKIVRCINCNWFTNSSHYGAYCTNFGAPLHDDYDGFCAWAERREVD